MSDRLNPQVLDSLMEIIDGSLEWGDAQLLKGHLSALTAANDAYRDELTRLKAQVEAADALADAVEFYTDDENYRVYDYSAGCAVEIDGGEIATVAIDAYRATATEDGG